MKKALSLLFIISMYCSDSFGCSCMSYNSFVESIVNYGYQYSDGIVEFEVLSNSTNSTKVKIVKVWKGNYTIDQQIDVWNYTRTVQSSCGQPSVGVSSFSNTKRYIASFYKKTGAFDNIYDAEGQLYIPSNPCGTAYLEVSEDSVKGATFGTQSYRSQNDPNTLEYNLPYEEFNRRFAEKLTTILGTEQEQLNASFQIYPNPVTTNLKVEGLIDDIKIINSDTKEEKIATQNGTIDVSHLPCGIYFLETTLAGKKIRRKFVKE